MGQRICSLQGCEQTAPGTNLLCSMHYERKRKHKDPGSPERIYRRRTPRGLSRLDSIRFHGWTVVDSGCWEWQGRTDRKGYGQITAKDHGWLNTYVHRISYELHQGPIPEGLLVRHACDNPPCLNPNHLLVGTKKDNSGDMIARNRHYLQDREQCQRGHDLTVPDAFFVQIMDGRRGQRRVQRCRICYEHALVTKEARRKVRA